MIVRIFAVRLLVAFAAVGGPCARAAPRTVADVYAPGDLGVWAFELGGKRIGTCWSRYEGAVELAGMSAHYFRAQVQLSTGSAGGTLRQRYAADLWTDSAGRPLRVLLQGSVADVLGSVDATFTGGEADVLVQQGPARQSLKPKVPLDSFLLANNFVSHLEIVLALHAPDDGASATYPMFSANTLQSFDFTVRPEPGSLGTGGAVYRDSLNEILRVDASGRLQVCEIPQQKIVIRRVSETVEPFVLTPPRVSAAPDFLREEVRIDYEAVSLSGTITKRPGSTGMMPTVFFVSGSGPQDRDGYSSGIDVGTHEILDRLTRDGFLVLRIDDRGVGRSTGPTTGIIYDDLVEDARRCVAFLRGRADVDPSRIVVIGHSEGGMTASILAAEGRIAAAVLMAAPGRPLTALMREQLLAARKLGGEGDAALKEFGAQVDGFLAAIARGETPGAPGLPPELRLLVADAPYVVSWGRVDSIATIRRVRCPVLLLQGARDIQVSLERDAKPLLAALDGAGNADHRLAVFEELDHLFKKTVGETSSGLDYLKARPVDESFLDTLAGWLWDRLL